MMGIYCGAKERVISERLGYPNSEEGLASYTRDLEECVARRSSSSSATVDDDRLLRELEDRSRETWVTVVATTFDFDPDDVPTLTPEEARNLSYKINTRMVEPDVLAAIQAGADGAAEMVAHLRDDDLETGERHRVVQQVILDRVYLSSPKSEGIVESAGFSAGDDGDDAVEVGYAKMQCALYPHRNDPFIARTGATAMARVWQAALESSK